MLIVVYVALALKTVEILHHRIECMLTETFFIDWERPRGHVIPERGEDAEVSNYRTALLFFLSTGGSKHGDAQSSATDTSDNLAHVHDRQRVERATEVPQNRTRSSALCYALSTARMQFRGTRSGNASE